MLFLLKGQDSRKYPTLRILLLPVSVPIDLAPFLLIPLPRDQNSASSTKTPHAPAGTNTHTHTHTSRPHFCPPPIKQHRPGLDRYPREQAVLVRGPTPRCSRSLRPHQRAPSRRTALPRRRPPSLPGLGQSEMAPGCGHAPRAGASVQRPSAVVLGPGGPWVGGGGEGVGGQAAGVRGGGRWGARDGEGCTPARRQLVAKLEACLDLFWGGVCFGRVPTPAALRAVGLRDVLNRACAG